MQDELLRKKEDIKKFLQSFESRKNRTIVIVDYGNVEKWKNSLGWKVDIQKTRLAAGFRSKWGKPMNCSITYKNTIH